MARTRRAEFAGRNGFLTLAADHRCRESLLGPRGLQSSARVLRLQTTPTVGGSPHLGVAFSVIEVGLKGRTPNSIWINLWGLRQRRSGGTVVVGSQPSLDRTEQPDRPNNPTPV